MINKLKMITKKQIFYIFSLVFILAIVSLYNKAYSQNAPILKGGITTVIQKGEILNVNLNTPINFYFSEIGDKVAFFTNEDILIGENSYIPKGSKFEGILTSIKEPKRFGQKGAFEVSFNEITTPDNLSIPISATASTDIQKTSEKITEILTYDAALIAYGTFHGFIAGVQYGGIPLAISSHGISLLAGAGIGAGTGIIGSAVRKGKIPTTYTGSGTPLTLKSNFYILGELPKKEKGKEKKEEFKGFRFFPPLNKNEIELSLLKINKEHSKTFGDYLVLELKIKNDSPKTISLTDIVLLNKKDSSLLHSDLFLTGTKALQTISPFEELSTSLAFVTSEKAENYLLIILDPLDGTEIVKTPLK